MRCASIAHSPATSERARASATLGDVDALVNTAAVTLADSSSAALDVALNPTGGSSLIFTEIAPASPPSKSGNQYYYGGYFRITNASDTVVALANKIWFDAYGGYIRSPIVPNGCSYFEALERGPGGIWTRYVYRFPPDATPLQPGASALLATDAIDHRSFGGAGFCDLSRADFEFVFGDDIDNPLSLNMISIGPREYEFAHGWQVRGGRQGWGLAIAVGMDTLPKIVRLPFDASQSTWVRIPKAALLEVVRYDWAIPHFDPLVVDCPSPILSDIDAEDAKLLTIEDTLTIHRRISRTLPNGRIVYQRARNSQADWIAGKATPGLIP